MPSLKQINNVELSSPKSKSGVFQALVWLVLLGGVVAVAGWHYYINRNIYTIPERIYKTKSKSSFNQLVSANKKKIFWFGGDDNQSIQQRRNIIYSVKYEHLDTFYDIKFYSKNDYRTTCSASGCLDGYIVNLCADFICIYVPKNHQIIKTTMENLYQDLHKYKNL